ncbi:MAG TPA: ATP-binding protein [Thermoanaerobaculia bacterium]|jgi:DNA polymerase III delta prime subunit|nr:ATP-binding protein [Thermoanaerobaculia bacterium]
MNAQVRFYNPREASPEVLETMLVGRDEVVTELEEDLHRQIRSSTRQHWLIRGPRGIGKTHLMGILCHRVRRDPQLSAAYLPVWLAETEVYEVYSVAILLLGIARQLVEELREGKDPGATELADRLAALEYGGDDPALFEELCELFREEAHRRGKILLILMENLDALFSGFAKQRSGQEVRRLRSLLTEEKHLLFLSTTPTRYLSQISNPKAPLYGHLKERVLQPLTEDQIGDLFRSLGQATGQTERGELLSGPSEEGRLRRRVIHRLAGGNPRSVVMAFSVVAGAPGVKAVVEEMSALLDTQTAYFEARLARLAPRERAIVTAMALAPTNLTVQEIAGLTRLPARSLSTQIDRLVEEGHLAPAEGEGGRGTIYEMSDGLFRLWYQYRKGRKVLWPIVQFLALWHSEEELERALVDLREALTAGAKLLESHLDGLVLRHFEKALTWARSEEGKARREEIREDYVGQIKIMFKEIEALIEHVLSLEKPGPGDIFILALCMGIIAALVGNVEEAEADIGRATKLLESQKDALRGFPGLWKILESVFIFFDLRWARKWIDTLVASGASETATLYSFVLEVLETGSPATGRQGRERFRRVLARVPPELRQTVGEIAEKVRESRRKYALYLSEVELRRKRQLSATE